MSLPAPVQLTPVSGASTVGEVEFSWEAVTGATKYLLVWSLDPLFSTFESLEVTDTSVTPDLLFGIGVWYWKVSAYDGTTWGTESSSWSFTITDCTVPLLLPVDEAVTVWSAYLSFSWVAVYGASNYEVQYATDASFTSPTSLFSTSSIYRDWETDRKSTRLNSSHSGESRMPSSA